MFPFQFERNTSRFKSLLIACVSALLALMFLWLGSEIMEGDTHSFDLRMLLAAQSLRLRYPWLSSVMRDLSGLGSTFVLTFFTVATVGYLALVSERINAALVAASVGLGTVLVSALKLGFARPRPDAAYAELAASELSFPSGHASMSAIVFLTIGALIASRCASLAQRIYILTSAAMLAFLVGLSRVSLGVHWATDVLGGWAFGGAWAIGWLLLAHQIKNRVDARCVVGSGGVPHARS